MPLFMSIEYISTSEYMNNHEKSRGGDRCDLNESHTIERAQRDSHW